jgi:GxxExxY protein
LNGPIEITEQIIKCAIEVDRTLGPGLRERTYEEALAIEMLQQHLKFERQVHIPVDYKGHIVGDYSLDFVVADEAVLEVKAVDRFDPLFEAQVISYLHASKLHVGLLLNFNCRRLVDGLRRFIR